MENQLTIRLPKELSKQVAKKARDLDLKRADVVRMALKFFMEIEEGGPSAVPVYERVKHLIGSVSTGIPDLAERHREYLIQKIKNSA